MLFTVVSHRKGWELKNFICTIPMRTIVETITASHCKISLQFLAGVVFLLPFLWLKEGPLEVKVYLNGWKRKAKKVAETSKARCHGSDYLHNFTVNLWATEAQRWKTNEKKILGA